MPHTPQSILELSGYYWKTCALHAAVKLDIFTAIDKNMHTIDAIATFTNSESQSMERLLNALVAMNFLKKGNDSYQNTKESHIFLSKSSDKYLGYIIMHHHHLSKSWVNLDQAIIHGKPIRQQQSTSDDDTREAFLMGMFNIAMGIAPRFAENIDLSNRTHLLDVGGGPGTYSIHFCLKNHKLKATVFDLPTTKPFAEKIITKFNLSKRIQFESGNFHEAHFSKKYDVAWLSHILHGEGPLACEKIINNVVAAVKPGGMILIHEFILNNTKDGPLFPALFSLNMLLGTSLGQAYSEKELMGMLTNAGCMEVTRFDISGPNDSGIIAGYLK